VNEYTGVAVGFLATLLFYHHSLANAILTGVAISGHTLSHAIYLQTRFERGDCFGFNASIPQYFVGESIMKRQWTGGNNSGIAKYSGSSQYAKAKETEKRQRRFFEGNKVRGPTTDYSVNSFASRDAALLSVGTASEFSSGRTQDKSAPPAVLSQVPRAFGTLCKVGLTVAVSAY